MKNKKETKKKVFEVVSINGTSPTLVDIDNIFVLKGKSFYDDAYKLGDYISYIAILSEDGSVLHIKAIVDSEIEKFLTEYFYLDRGAYSKKQNIGVRYGTE